MTEEELAPLRSLGAERRVARDDAVARVQSRYDAVLATKAGELATTGTVRMRTNAGTVEARIVRFRHGDSVLEIDSRHPSSHRQGVARARLVGAQVADLGVLTGYLIRSVAQLVPDVEVEDGPIT